MSSLSELMTKGWIECMKLYRKLVALCLTAALAAGMAITASASAPITVSVNGTACDVSAYVNSDDRTMVPVEIADSLGLTYTVSGSSVTFTGNGVSQTYTVGTAVGDTAPALVDGKIYVPFYHLAQVFGYTVSWNEASNQAIANLSVPVPSSASIQSIQATTDMCFYGQKLTEVAITYAPGTDLRGITTESYTLYDRGSANPSFAPAKIVDTSVDGNVVTLEITTDTERTAERSRNSIGAVTTGAWYISTDDKLYYGSEDSVDPLSGDTYYANTTGKGYQSRENLDLVLCSGDDTFDEGLRLTDGYGNYSAEDKWLPTINLLSDNFHTEYVDVNSAVSEETGTEYVAPGYEAFDGKVPVVVHAPDDYATESYPMVVYVCGGGTSYWELYNEDGTILANNPGTNLYFDAALTNWLDEDVIIVSPQVHSNDNIPAAHEVAAVTEYYIDKYNADEDQIIYVGNSNGAALLSETIRMYPDLVDVFFPTNGDLGVNDPPEGGSVSNRDSLYTWTEEELKAMAESGLAVWFNTGETDTRHFLVVQLAYEKIIPYYKAAGYSDEWIEDNIRISAYMSWQFKYWGESDHSCTRLIWSKYADTIYTDVLPGSNMAPGDTYHLTGTEDFNYEGAENFEYTLYDNTLHEWALSR